MSGDRLLVTHPEAISIRGDVILYWQAAKSTGSVKHDPSGMIGPFMMTFDCSGKTDRCILNVFWWMTSRSILTFAL